MIEIGNRGGHGSEAEGGIYAIGVGDLSGGWDVGNRSNLDGSRNGSNREGGKRPRD